MENNTGKYPDVAKNLPKAVLPTTKSYILDCEIVAFDLEKNRLLPFQILSTRARKSVTLDDIKVPPSFRILFSSFFIFIFWKFR